MRIFHSGLLVYFQPFLKSHCGGLTGALYRYNAIPGNEKPRSTGLRGFYLMKKWTASDKIKGSVRLPLFFMSYAVFI